MYNNIKSLYGRKIKPRQTSLINVKRKQNISSIALLSGLVLLVIGLIKLNFVVILFSLLVLATSIYFFLKFKSQLTIIREGKILEFTIVDNSRHLGSRGIIYYCPIVMDPENSLPIEVMDRKHPFQYLKGGKILGYKFEKKYFFIESLEKIAIKKDELAP